MTNIPMLCSKHGLKNIKSIIFNVRDGAKRKTNKNIVVLECGCSLYKEIMDIKIKEDYDIK